MNLGGIALIVFLILFFPLCGLYGWAVTRQRRAVANRIEPAFLQPDPVAPPPIHVHILDLERSDPRVTDIGGVIAQCIVAGCQETVYIAPSLAKSYIAHEIGIKTPVHVLHSVKEI
jgi:hypothetical protein